MITLRFDHSWTRAVEVRSSRYHMRCGDRFLAAHAMTKKALHQEWNMGIDEAIEAEAQTQALCMQTQDFVRAYRAFVNRSSPAFTGE